MTSRTRTRCKGGAIGATSSLHERLSRDELLEHLEQLLHLVARLVSDAPVDGEVTWVDRVRPVLCGGG